MRQLLTRLERLEQRSRVIEPIVAIRGPHETDPCFGSFERT
jgi:hypothetical protein